MTTAADLLRAICAEPQDDALRLVYADWLEENGDAGQQARAEFIRCQIQLTLVARTGCCDRVGNTFITEPIPQVIPCGCPWAILRRREAELLGDHIHVWTPQLPDLDSGYLLTSRPEIRLRQSERWDSDVALTFRRGFVAFVTLPLAALVGGVCPCGGDFTLTVPCKSCAGTGRIPGSAAALFGCQPVTEVRTDREPYTAHETFDWWDVSRLRGGMDSHPPSSLLPEIWGLLEGGAICSVIGMEHCREYPDEASAHAALSAALVAHCRTLAGLPPLAKPSLTLDTPSPPPAQ